MEKVGDSQSSSEPVSSTSKDQMMKRQKRVLKVEAESSETCMEKIKGVLEKLRERGDIDTWCEETDGMVMVLGYFDPEKLTMELENEAGDAIKSITDTTNSIHIIRDGILVIELENQGAPQENHKKIRMENPSAASRLFMNVLSRMRKEQSSAKIPRMPILESGDRRTEILYHSEKPMEHSNNSQWRSRGVMANNLEIMGDAGGSEFPKIPTAEVFDNPKVILNRSDKTMESSKTQCSIL
ncbi:uncharacterized protein LOC141817124 [Curcuma longa]|uniref:uncharacterized protein LOC141817124 n=1 Tax=Curcuma longa TaxID=136217 RepID=UPI003D9F1D35